MGKDNKSQFDAKALVRLRKQVEEQEQILAMHCNHQKANGNLNTKVVDEYNGVFQCKTCGDKFSMVLYGEDEAKEAIFKVHSMIQQLRAVSRTDEDSLVENYGKVSFALSKVGEQFNNMVESMAKGNRVKNKNKGKNKHNNSIGGYASQISITPRGGNGGRNKRR